ncbi:MAG: hypothetical protein LGR52_14535 [Candidatus Thiosymbion ectosymbiont of Robbea hypermnestra]|nr:hypothetical protein [Candidatus Thiosymbion ectosymbiont of Robbea hypermnestra]
MTAIPPTEPVDIQVDFLPNPDRDSHGQGDHLPFSMNMNRATTIYADIASVPPAQILLGGTRSTSVRAYWDGPEERAYVRYPHPEEYVERFRALIDFLCTVPPGRWFANKRLLRKSVVLKSVGWGARPR